jgi:hypothetical protein
VTVLSCETCRADKLEHVIKPRLGGQIEDTLGVIGCRFIQARAAPGGRLCLLQFGALGGEADFGKAQEDQAEDRTGVFLRLEAGVGPELISGTPKTLFQRVSGRVLLRWRDSDHAFPVSLARVTAWVRKPVPSPGWRQMLVIIAIPRAMRASPRTVLGIVLSANKKDCRALASHGTAGA